MPRYYPRASEGGGAVQHPRPDRRPGRVQHQHAQRYGRGKSAPSRRLPGLGFG